MELFRCGVIKTRQTTGERRYVAIFVIVMMKPKATFCGEAVFREGMEMPILVGTKQQRGLGTISVDTWSILSGVFSV